MLKLDFTDQPGSPLTVSAENRYGICAQSIAMAGSPVVYSAWDDVINLTDKLKSIAEGESRPFPLLKKGGGEVFLTSEERTQLINFIKSGPWIPSVLKDVRSTLNWIQSAEDVPTAPQKVS